jgi:hypothetical protein
VLASRKTAERRFTANVLGIEQYRRHGSPYRPGDERAALWHWAAKLTTAGALPPSSGIRRSGTLFQQIIGVSGVLVEVFVKTRMALLAGLGFASLAMTAPAPAATQDGNWSVSVITEQGTCDRGYRYDVSISNGRVNYTGDAAIDLSGTVTPAGAVKVSISKGSQRAEGTGRLSGAAGNGTWRGQSSGGDCTGRWDAERR